MSPEIAKRPTKVVVEAGKVGGGREQDCTQLRTTELEE